MLVFNLGGDVGILYQFFYACSIANKHVFIFRQTFHTTLRNGVIPACLPYVSD